MGPIRVLAPVPYISGGYKGHSVFCKVSGADLWVPNNMGGANPMGSYMDHGSWGHQSFGERCQLASHPWLASNAIYWRNFLKHCNGMHAPSSKCRPMVAHIGHMGPISWLVVGWHCWWGFGDSCKLLSPQGSPQLLVSNAILLSFWFCCCNLLQQTWFCLFSALTYYACPTSVGRLCKQGFKGKAVKHDLDRC